MRPGFFDEEEARPRRSNGWVSSTGHLCAGYVQAPVSTYKHDWTQDFGAP